MSSDLIGKALKMAVETEGVISGSGVTSQTGEMFTKPFPGARALVVADESTFGATDEKVVASLKAVGVEFTQEPYTLPGEPMLYGDYGNVKILCKHAEPLGDTVVYSIGTGTLNSTVKLASDELGRPYMNACTAASVDGFTTFGASISRDGFRITRPYPGPTGLVTDNDIICNAPERLTVTGYGGLTEKIPAGADWILVDVLGIEPINEYVWNMVQDPLCGSPADPEAIGNGNGKTIESLMGGDLMSGLAMQAGQSSRSASGAGHQFSHMWEMEGHRLDREPPLLHRFKVGVGMVASYATWEESLKVEAEDFDVDRALAAVKSPEQIEPQVHVALKPRVQGEAVRHSLKKRTEGEELVVRIELLEEKWPELRERLRAQLMAPEEIMDRLKMVGTPYRPKFIEIDWDRFRETHFKAQMIRDHYTVFDILVDLGVYDAVVEKLFSPEGFWSRHHRPAK